MGLYLFRLNFIQLVALHQLIPVAALAGARAG